MTDEEEYLYTCLMEECGELIQAICKMKRHGPQCFNPNDPDRETNLDAVFREMNDVIAVMQHLSIPIDCGLDYRHRIEKRERLVRFMREDGIIEDEDNE